MSFTFLNQLPTPEEIKRDYPLTPELAELKKQRDAMISDVITGKDSRFLVIIGPCSADNEDSVCDYVSRLTKIQEDVKITSQEDFDNYLKTMRIYGLGGTDFRPVFEHVDKLINEKEFSNLKGLIYFTDGIGFFPKQRPKYEAAFVFIDDKENNYDVPPWAIKLILKKDEI